MEVTHGTGHGKEGDDAPCWVVDAGGKTFAAQTLWWSRVDLLEDMPVVMRTTQKKDGSIVRKKVKPPMNEQIEFAIRPHRIPRVVEEFKKRGVQEVLIETQLTNLQSMGGPFGGRGAGGGGGNMAGNLLMKVLSHILQVLLRLAIPDVTITFVSGAGTIPLCDDIAWADGSTWESSAGKPRTPKGAPRKKPQKKRLAIDTMSYILGCVDPGGECPHHAAFRAQKKKDDMADAMLQVWGYLRHAKPETKSDVKNDVKNEKTYDVKNDAKNDVKKGSSRKRKEPLLEENDPSRREAQQPSAKRAKRANLKETSEVNPEGMSEMKGKTMADLRGELKAWKCSGYSGMKRAELEEFYLKAKAHVEKRQEAKAFKATKTAKATLKRKGGAITHSSSPIS